MRGAPSATKIFLTGDPGCGKTTVLRRVVELLRPTVPMTGFLTEEVLKNGRRRGFCGLTLDGLRFLLAEVGLDTPFRLGPYGVTTEGLESVGVPSLVPGAKTRLIVLDEVGKMESSSEAFRQSVLTLLDGDTAVLGTVAAHGVGFVKRVRHDPRITLIRMSREAREGMVGELLRRLAEFGVGPGTGARRRISS